MQFYIDPGTGSMLFTVLIGLVSAGVYGLRSAMIKLRFMASGGRASQEDALGAPFAIFTDSKRYWNVFEPICDEFERLGKDVTYFTASPDDPGLQKPYEHVHAEFVGEGNKAFAKLNMLRADIVLSSTPGLDVYQWKRSRDVKWYAHVLHAVSDATMYRMFGIDYYDSVLLTGEYQVAQVRELERLRNLPAKELPVVGAPFMDEMAKRLEGRAGRAGCGERDDWDGQDSREGQGGLDGRESQEGEEGQGGRDGQEVQDGQESRDSRDSAGTTVLLAPSWGDSAIFSLYGSAIVDALLETGYHVILRPHPQSFVSETKLMDSLMAQYPESEQLEWNRDNDNFDVLGRSDILISDFSGVVFDFALVFDRPIIYTEPSYDKAPYDACWLADETWTFTTLPKIGRQLTRENVSQLKDIIDECLTDTRYAEAREAARGECWANRGGAAREVVRYLVAKREELLAEQG